MKSVIWRLSVWTILLLSSCGGTEFNVGISRVSIEPTEETPSLTLAGYASPWEGRFSLRWDFLCDNELRSTAVCGDSIIILDNSGNIYKELKNDLGLKIPDNGCLVPWAKQGVLLLNTVLTVRAHQANSHRGIGWEDFTDAAIRVLNEQDRPIVFMLWGRPAQMKKSMLNNPRHLILEAPHPSPLSAFRGFFGCRHFSKANAFLKEHGLEPIDWQIENRQGN